MFNYYKKMFTLTLKSELGENLGGDKTPFADNN